MGAENHSASQDGADQSNSPAAPVSLAAQRQIPRPPLPFGIGSASQASPAQIAVQDQIRAAMEHDH